MEELTESMSLTDLDPELLLQCLLPLSARARTAASASCKLFSLLVDEIHAEAAHLITLTHEPGVMGPSRSLLASARAMDYRVRFPPNVGILLSSKPIHLSVLEELVHTLPPQLHLIGAKVANVFVNPSVSNCERDGSKPAPKGAQNNDFGITLGAFPEAEVSSFAIHDPGRASETSLRRAFFEKRRVEMLGKSSEASETASTAQLEERYAHLHELDHQLSAEWAALSRVEKLAYAESRPWEDQLAAADAATAPDAKVFIVLSTARGAHFLDAFLRRLQSMHPAAAIVGGIVSSGAGCVLASRQVVRRVDSGVACLAFRGNVPLTALICREEKSHMQEKLTQVKTHMEASGQELLGTAMFTCTARDGTDDLKSLLSVFGGQPVLGMAAGGEIGPRYKRGRPSAQTGDVELQGFTCVCGLFVVPRRMQRACQLAFRSEDIETEWATRRKVKAAILAAARDAESHAANAKAFRHAGCAVMDGVSSASSEALSDNDVSDDELDVDWDSEMNDDEYHDYEDEQPFEDEAEELE